MIFAIYGLDGSGKSTQAQILATHLSNYGYEPKVVAPFDCGELISTVKALAMRQSNCSYESVLGGKIVGTLLLEDVWDNVKKAVQMNELIVFDRYYLDFYVYSSLLQSDLEFQRPILSMFPKATASIFLDVNPKKCIQNVIKRSESDELYLCKREDRHIQDVARDGYLALARAVENYYIINANNKSEAETGLCVWDVISQFL